MTSLTQIAITSRKVIRYTVFFIVFLTIGRILLNSGASIYLKLFPPAPPPPTVKFGKLGKIPFPSTSGPVPKLNFTLETATGSLPTNIPTQAKVYFMPKVSSNLLSFDTAKTEAEALGFNDPNPVQESDSLYKFKDPNYPSTMEINIITGAFSISYDLTADRTPIDNRPPVAEVAASEFNAALSSANILPGDLTGPMVPGYLKLTDGRLQDVLSLSEADVVKVNLFRKSYDNLPCMTANPNQSNVWAIISGGQVKDQQIIAAQYDYYPVDETQYSTYPIITPAQAFSELQAGDAYIASMGQYKDGDSLKIRNIYLAYFDPDTSADFYQPIYVFDSGETDPTNSFIGYIPAVSPTYYGGN
jgi:hypothetical protein